MQLASGRRWAARCGTFSILGRIGGDATLVGVADLQDGAGLSVSSVGSEAMQQRPAGRVRSVDGRGLSVSSVGSEAMQLFLFAPLYTLVRALSVSSVGSEAMQLAG